MLNFNSPKKNGLCIFCFPVFLFHSSSHYTYKENKCFSLGDVGNIKLYTVEIYGKLSLNGWFRGINLPHVFLAPYSSSYMGEFQDSYFFSKGTRIYTMLRHKIL